MYILYVCASKQDALIFVFSRLTALFQLDTTRPFYIVVEVDKQAVRGEQLGVQVALFNNWDQNMEVSEGMSE